MRARSSGTGQTQSRDNKARTEKAAELDSIPSTRLCHQNGQTVQSGDGKKKSASKKKTTKLLCLRRQRRLTLSGSFSLTGNKDTSSKSL